MNLIGLTGGIGSGKSTVANVFRTLGIPVYESDSRARELMHVDDQLRQKIVALFGPEAYSPDRMLNRKWIASLVFNDQSLLEKLNEIVHPAVYQDLLLWSNEQSQKQAPYLIQESAIIFEEHLARRMKAVILVVAPEEIRIGRVTRRDKVSSENVLERIKHQWPDSEKIPLADYIIYNDGERSLIDQVMDIDRMIRRQL
jgi:dephospho-CoA kinase